ncbi:TetR family transcriptional regulator [Pandoraea terrae]|uniref:TetR family transcriptional regulator n=1 Tax=Pandoraea terrae TaxID=1537710 RepID=A0A5E4ZFJ6_9BURK|nr:TetR/AcrR family transcriptional regulator [Pandoraea terrae]VVE59628.1 TetR family transcriptional regulator [Pandoraea terrae]
MMETTKVPTDQRGIRGRRTSGEAAAGAAPDGLRAQGLRTRNAIVRVARKLLLESGPLEFSLRAVALRAGISVSNLQYYFPTRLAVLRAVMEPEINAYLDEVKRMLASCVPPQEVHDAIVQRSLRDANDATYTALWRHFFSFASTDPECAKLCDEWYSTLTHELAKLIRAVNPKFGTADSMHVAALLIAMADGLPMQLGTGRRKHAYMRGLDERYIATVNYIVQGGTLGVSVDQK